MRKSHLALLVCGVALGFVVRDAAARRSQTLIPQLENAHVRVWKTVLAPHEQLGMTASNSGASGLRGRGNRPNRSRRLKTVRGPR